MRYVDLFLSLRCAPDVLAVCGPVAGATKEIMEPGETAVFGVYEFKKFIRIEKISELKITEE